jgi:Bacterial regulatory helix-turn-helix protein, lysR family
MAAMNFQQIRYFLTLCEEQNFTRAAARCGVKQPTLTRAIKELEVELGGPLFVRSWRATRLTSLGTAVQPHIAGVDRSATAAKRAAVDFLATSSVLVFQSKKKAVRKIVYGASIAAAVLLATGGAGQPSHAAPTRQPAQTVGTTDVYASDATIDVDALPRHEFPTAAETD